MYVCKRYLCELMQALEIYKHEHHLKYALKNINVCFCPVAHVAVTCDQDTKDVKVRLKYYFDCANEA